MDRRIFWLRLCYWLGAIFDGLVIIPMLSPETAVQMFGMSISNLGVEYRYAMGVGASLMAGWTVLLIWADRRPVERSAILLITLFPVLSGLIVASIYAMAQGMLQADRMVPILIPQGLLFVLDIFTYTQSRSLKAQPRIS